VREYGPNYGGHPIPGETEAERGKRLNAELCIQHARAQVEQGHITEKEASLKIAAATSTIDAIRQAHGYTPTKGDYTRVDENAPQWLEQAVTRPAGESPVNPEAV
jgi:hypothetical protein